MLLKTTTFTLLTCCSCLSFAQDFTNFQQPFSRYEVAPDSCIRIEHTSGSLIFIEADAIITDSKKVDILYREYLTPLDMLAHGIRMHMLIGEDRLQLESSGMFEIYAMDGTDTLLFDPNKRMEVRLNGTTIPNPGTEGYQYDPTNQIWENYTSRIDNRGVVEDDNLWGSSLAQEEQIVMDTDDTFGESFLVDTVRRNVFQGMEINDFGMYNYDRIIEGEEYVYITAQFVSNKKGLNSEIYVVYDNINSVFYFPDYTWSDQFFLIKGKSYKLFTIASDGKILKLGDPPDLTPLKGQPYTFVLDSQSEIPKDRATFTKLTGIQ